MSAAGQLASQADRAALAEVLAAPEFQAQRWRGDELRRWLAGWWERITELLGTTEAERWADLGRAVFLSAVGVAVLLLWRAARRRGRRGRAGAAATAPGPGSRAHRPAPASALAAAGRALTGGDGPGAVRLAFQAAVEAVARRLPAAAAEALTGRELAGRLRDDGFSWLAWLHERTVFGRCPVTAAEGAEALAAAQRLVAGLEPGVASPRPEASR